MLKYQVDKNMKEKFLFKCKKMCVQKYYYQRKLKRHSQNRTPSFDITIFSGKISAPWRIKISCKLQTFVSSLGTRRSLKREL